jgi:DDE superfamily endonuclease
VITALLPVIAEVTAPFVPNEKEATEAVSGRIALVDGTLAPCWSWQERRDLFDGKHATTGHNFIVIADLGGQIRYITDPRPGKDHDMAVLKETAAARILASASDVIGDKGFQGSGYVTPIKKPQGGHLTFLQEDFNNKISGLRAAIERARSPTSRTGRSCIRITDAPSPPGTKIPRGHRTLLLQPGLGFCISLLLSISIVEIRWSD